MVESQYLFCTCQAGAEGALKSEVAARSPELRFAYSRPGFITFKLPEPATIEKLSLTNWTFSRMRGLSLGKVAKLENLSAMAQGVWELEPVKALVEQGQLKGLHVWQRDDCLPGEDDFEPGVSPLAETAREALIACAQIAKRPEKESEKEIEVSPEASDPEASGEAAQVDANEGSQVVAETNTEESSETTGTIPGIMLGNSVADVPSDGLILDVVMVEPDEWWVGIHRAQRRIDRWPGAVPPLEMPEHAVSRAYLKISEALYWAGMPSRKGEFWIDMGCAPGGASQALLDQGMKVLGVDPAEVDDIVLDDPNFRHLQKRSIDVRRKEFQGATWLACDINAAPRYTLEAVEGVVTHRTATTIRGVIMTLKLTKWELATPEQLSKYVAQVRSWGYQDVRLRQLAFNRREICVVALRSRAQRRVKRGGSGKRRGAKPASE